IGHLARIEVGPKEIGRFFQDGLHLRVAETLRQAGYLHVTLDLQGYRRGSVNEILQQKNRMA
ncbi:MAG TPA: TIGR00268 family protein, partial [Verrucomicrobiota bacterium]|nr:TIGR00268 family protein [Verrucomicrobiota bacterium]